MNSTRPIKNTIPNTRAATTARVRLNALRSASFLLLLNGEDRRDWVDGHLVPVALVPYVRDVLKRRYLLHEMAELLSILPHHIIEAFAPIKPGIEPEKTTKKALDRAINRALGDLTSRDQKTLLKGKPPLITPRVLAVMQDLKLNEHAALAFCAKHNASPLPYRKAYMARIANWTPCFG
jgi:hypothetical protein